VSFYLRKSLNFGPIRFNLSKSGIGVSAGVRGLRIGTGPRGNYIHAGRGGLYYRKTLSTRTPDVREASVPLEVDSPVTHKNPGLGQPFLLDGSATDLLGDLNEKRKQTRRWPLYAIIFFIVIAIAAFNGASQATVAILALCSVALIVPLAIRQQRQKTTVLFFDLETQVLASFQSLHSAFEKARSCSRFLASIRQSTT
jgi:Protein of unknown function (DUF4236)